MSGIVDVCNLALGRLRAGSINDLTETSPGALACSLYYEPTLRAVLTQTDWQCARTRVALAETTNDRPTEWAHRFQLPANHGKTLRVPYIPDTQIGEVWLGDASIPSPYGPYTARDLPDLPFLISGRSVYTNVAPAFMEFIPTDLDPSKFSVRFERAFVASLAAAMAYKVTGDRALVKDLQTEAAALVAQMAADDANDDNEILNPLPAGIAARL